MPRVEARLVRWPIVACLVFLVLAPAAVSAQTSGLAGTIKDTSGGTLPGVTVEASSPALIERVRVVVTDDHGEYKITGLRPGIYTMTFTLPGFSVVKREGIELTPNFTAPVDAELTVGGISETITVAAQFSPLVDVQNLTQRQVLSATLLDSVPVQKNIVGFSALTPAAIIPATGQDVGGSAGELSVRMTMHGSKQEDARLMWDGMLFNQVGMTGTQRGYFVNPAGAEDLIVQLPTAGSAESATGGVVVDTIPKDGGNRFNAYVFANYAGDSFQGSNLTPALQAAGLRAPNSILNLYDINGGIGGPIVKDRLWFYNANRYWLRSYLVANLYRNSTQGTMVYTPDFSRPAKGGEWYDMHSLRLAMQATKKDKITLSGEYQHAWNGNAFATGTTAWEAATGNDYHRGNLYQATWTRPHTNRLLFQAGISILQYGFATAMPGFLKDETADIPVTFDTIPINEQSIGFSYNAPGGYNTNRNPQQNGRVSMSYVTGSHAFKVGSYWLAGYGDVQRNVNNRAVTYTLRKTTPVVNGVLDGLPVQLTLLAPTISREHLAPDFNLYAQDQWTINRFTVNAGVLFAYLRAYVPAQTAPAGLLVPERSYQPVDCVPCWKDVSPRFGVAWDVAGNGKTAIKVGVSRYLAGMGTGNAQNVNPAQTALNSVTRQWNDSFYPVGDPRRGNFIADCDLKNPQANAECAIMSNVRFGQPVATTRYAPDTMNGWGKRGYNWSLSSSIQHELMQGVALSGGYHRTSYYNFLVTQNQANTPADWSQYCVTAPADSRLPGGGGQQICGLYDLNPTKNGAPLFGVIDNVITFASNFGKQTEVYNGVDGTISARFPNGAMVSGGFNVGNQIAYSSAFTGTSSATDSCYVVNSPQQLYQCKIEPPYQKQVKMIVNYPLPLGLRASANFQSLPGPPITATWNAPVALITPTLGRPLSNGGATAPVSLIQPGSVFQPRINQLDLRLSKNLRMGGGRLQLTLDCYNALNASPILSQNNTFGPSWLTPTQILAARLFKIGVQANF